MEKMEWGRNANPSKGPPSEPLSDVARAELFRQRRQLLWLTFALVIYYCAGIKLGHEAESQGVKFSIGSPEFLVWAVWFAWAWSLWRYWQYERTHPDKNYRAWREHQSWITAVQIASRKAFTESSAKKPLPDLPSSSAVEIFTDRDIETGLTMDGGLHVKNFGLRRQSENGPTVVTSTASVSLSAGEFSYAKRQGRWTFVMQRPYAMDYKAPYFLAALAPLARLWTWVF